MIIAKLTRAGRFEISTNYANRILLRLGTTGEAMFGLHPASQLIKRRSLQGGVKTWKSYFVVVEIKIWPQKTGQQLFRIFQIFTFTNWPNNQITSLFLYIEGDRKGHNIIRRYSSKSGKAWKWEADWTNKKCKTGRKNKEVRKKSVRAVRYKWENNIQEC